MDTIKYAIASTVYTLAQFLEKYFYYILTSFILLALYNTFIYKDWDALLFKAANDGNIPALEEAIKNNGDVNAQPAGECTPLMIACLKNQIEATKLLVATKRCRLELIDILGRSALYCACQAGNLEVVKFLLKNNAKPRTADNHGNSPLIIASGEGHADVVRYLLEQKAEIAWKNKEGFNALTYAIAKYDSKTPLASSPTTITTNNNNNSSKLAVIGHLLDYKMNVESINKNGWSALLVASYRGHIDIVRLLISYRANVNFQTDTATTSSGGGFSPLIAACQNGWKDIVVILLEYGADVDVKLSDGSNAFIAACSGGYHELVEYLGTCYPHLVYTKFKAGSNALLAAVLKGYISVVKVLIKLGVDINIKNNDGWNAIVIASQHGYCGILKLLIENKADVNCYTSRGFTPLMYAIKTGYKDIASILIENGAIINHFDINNDTNMLVKKGEMPLLYGYITPIMLAITRLDSEILNLLLLNNNDDDCGDIHTDLSKLIMHGEFPYKKFTEPSTNNNSTSTTSSSSSKGIGYISGGGITGFTTSLGSKTINEVENRKQAALEAEKFKEDEIYLDALNDATFVYSFCSTPLLLAVYLNNQTLVNMLLSYEKQQLLKYKDKLNKNYAKNYTNNTDFNNTIISKYKDNRIIDQRNTQGMGVLEIAARNNAPAMFFLLINHQAEFDSPLLLFSSSRNRSSCMNTIWVYMMFVLKLIYHWKFWYVLKFAIIVLYRFIKTILTFGKSRKKISKKIKSD